MIFAPTFIFNLLVATFYGAVAHLILNGKGRRLLLFILASWMGFLMGQAISSVMDLRLIAVGSTNLLPASLGAIIAIVVAAIFTRTRKPRSKRI